MECVNTETFTRIFRETYSKYSSKLALQSPEFDVNNPIMAAEMKSSSGKVRILLGPPEFHPEITIKQNDGTKYNLGDIYGFESAADWMRKRRNSGEIKSGLRGEVEWLFDLLTYAVLEIEEFKWLKHED